MAKVTKEEATEVVTCPECGGTGRAWDYIRLLGERVLDVCATCQGRGKVERPAKTTD